MYMRDVSVLWYMCMCEVHVVSVICCYVGDVSSCWAFVCQYVNGWCVCVAVWGIMCLWFCVLGVCLVCMCHVISWIHIFTYFCFVLFCFFLCLRMHNGSLPHPLPWEKGFGMFFHFGCFRCVCICVCVSVCMSVSVSVCDCFFLIFIFCFIFVCVFSFFFSCY